MNFPADPALDHVLTLRISFGEGDEEEEIVAATIHLPSREGQMAVAQAIISFVSAGAERVTATDEYGEVVYHEDRNLASAAQSPFARIPSSRELN